MIIDLIKKNIPEYKITLPVSNKKCSFRPLLVKEEKYFSIITNISSTFEDRMTNLCSMVDSCFDNKLKSSLLPIPDFQFILNSIRQKSIGETSKIKLTCPYTKEQVLVNLNLNSVSTQKSQKQFSLKIKEDFLMTFRCPRITDILEFSTFPETDEDYFSLVSKCLVEIETPSEKINVENDDILEKNKYIELVEKSKYKEVKEFVCNSSIKFKIEYKTSDERDREIDVDDFVNFLKFYLVILTL